MIDSNVLVLGRALGSRLEALADSTTNGVDPSRAPIGIAEGTAGFPSLRVTMELEGLKSAHTHLRVTATENVTVHAALGSDPASVITIAEPAQVLHEPLTFTMQQTDADRLPLH